MYCNLNVEIREQLVGGSTVPMFVDPRDSAQFLSFLNHQPLMCFSFSYRLIPLMIYFKVFKKSAYKDNWLVLFSWFFGFVSFINVHLWMFENVPHSLVSNFSFCHIEVFCIFCIIHVISCQSYCHKDFHNDILMPGISTDISSFIPDISLPFIFVFW